MSTGAIGLRPADAADAAAIAGMLTELGYPAAATEIAPRIGAVLGQGGAVFIAEDDGGRPVGLVSVTKIEVLHAARPIGYITALVTTAAARRRGVGRALVSAAREWAQRQGCVRLSVTSAEHRADAHAFYPACGIPLTGRRFSVSLADG